MPCPNALGEVTHEMKRRIPSFSSLTEAVMSVGHSGEPVWVWALWRPGLVMVAFAALLFRFLERFRTGPPHPWLASPLLFTVAYCAMLSKAVPTSNASEHRPHLAGVMSPGSRAGAAGSHAPSSRFGGVLDLAAVERWQYALNLHQLLISTWVLSALLHEVRSLRMPLWGSAPDPSPRAYRLGWLLWVVYANRYLQGLDTLFLLLRDKYVSVLHVFQQLALVWSWWLVLRVNAGGDSWFAAAVQSAYNSISYGYFVYKRNKRPTLRAQRRITHFLMALLAFSAVHTTYVLCAGTTPRLLCIVDLLVMGSMLLLFGNYRYHKYLKPFERVLAERRASGPVDTSRHAAGGGERTGGDGAVPPVPRHMPSVGSASTDLPGIGPKLVLSFDSSGWLYLYHFGVCRFMQLHVLRGMPAERFAFSGSSGGALAATALACDVPIDDLVDEILAVCWPWCRQSPFAMCPAVEYALNKFLPDTGDRQDAWARCSGRLRLLVTRVIVHPPWFLGDVISRFDSQRQLRAFLRASCHMPLFGGVLPYRVDGRWYFDGLFWASFLVPWRRPTARDHVLKVSAIGAPTAHLKPPAVPPWWTVMPPSTAVLRALYEKGYQDALLAFRETADGGGGWGARVALAPAVRDSISRVKPPLPAERALVDGVIGRGISVAWRQVLCALASVGLAVAFARFCAA